MKAVQVLGLQPQIGRPVEDMPDEYREWLIDFGDSGYVARYRFDGEAVTILPVLPTDAARSLVAWFSTASGLQEWLLSFAAAINLNALMLPLLYALGVLIIGLSSWVSKKNIDLKRQAVR